MVFFVFGTYRSQRRAPNQTELLGNHSHCLNGSCLSYVDVIEVSRTCHFCFLPLFPLGSHHVVKCPRCRYQCDLDVHTCQSRAKHRQAPPTATAVLVERVETNDILVADAEAIELGETKTLVEDKQTTIV